MLIKKRYFFLLIFILCLNSVWAIGTYPNVDPNMVLYYHFNNQSAFGENESKVYDFSGNNNNGSLINGTYNLTNSILNDGSLYFTNKSYINVNYSNSLNITNQISISLWVYPVASPITIGASLVRKGDVNGGQCNFLSPYELGMDTDRTIYFKISNSSGNSTKIWSASALGLNQWTYVTAVYNTTNVIIYLNGIQSKIGNITGIICSNNQSVGINSNIEKEVSYYNTLNGSLDEIIIYNKTLLSNEVYNLYRTYLPKSCVNLTDDTVISDYLSPTYLCPDNYYINDTNQNGVIQIGASNVILDCNGSSIIGNWTSTDLFYPIGIKATGYNNITISNCKVNNYNHPIESVNSNGLILNNITENNSKFSYFSNAVNLMINNFTSTYSSFCAIYTDSTTANITIKNSYFTGSYYSSMIFHSLNSVVSNFNITNNIFNERAIEFYNVTNSYVSYNLWNKSNGVSRAGGWNTYGVYAQDGGYNTFSYNNMSNNNPSYGIGDTGLYSGIQLQGLENYDNISFNYFYNNNNAGNILVYTSYNNIFNNTCDKQDKCIYLSAGDNNNIYNNFINNSYMNYDGYDTAIMVEGNSDNNLIHDNTIDRYGTYGIFVRKSNNDSIYNNIINTYNHSVQTYPAIPNIDENEYPCAFGVLQLMKTWYGDSTESTTHPTINLTTSRLYRSSNINFYNNTLGSNNQCFLRNQGGINVSNDFTNFWYRSFQFPSENYDRDNFYLNNNFDTLYLINFSGQLTTIANNGFKNKFNYGMYSINKNFMYFINNNLSLNYNLSINNQSSSLILLSNNSIIGSSDISQNNGDFNITLYPSDQSIYTDSFSYSAGTDTIKPNWIPQYNGYTFSDGNRVLLNYTSPTNGDRDLDITLNMSGLGLNNLTRPINMSWTFNVTACNQTYKDVYGVNPIASSGYMWLGDKTAGNNFLSVEIKLLGGTGTCTAGAGSQISLFKRIGGVTTALIPFTTYTSAFNQTFNVTLSLTSFNSTNYNYSIWLNGVIKGSSTNISKSELNTTGWNIVEVAGTSTYYDNFKLVDPNTPNSVYVYPNFSPSSSYGVILATQNQSTIDALYLMMGWIEPNYNPIVCHNSLDIINGVVILLPLIIVLMIGGLLYGASKGVFNELTYDKFLMFSAGFLVLCLILGIGLVILMNIGGGC
jgi:hypothetical protein